MDSVETSLISRARAELAQQFDFARPVLIASAPGCLDVMGGIAADDTGAIACQMPLDRRAAVLLQQREADRDLQLFSFDLYDQHLPFTFRIPLARLAQANAEQLKREFAEPGRGWAAHAAGCLFVLHERRLIDLNNSTLPGLNVAIHSTIPAGAGLGSSAALQVAMMRCLVEQFSLQYRVDAIEIALLCQNVSRRIAGVSRGIREALTCCCARPGEIMRVRCQPCELLPPLVLPEGFQIVGISSGAKPSDVERRARRTRIAAAMGHAIILAKMREMGRSTGRELISDPMGGYLANLDQEDYKKFFRSQIPQRMSGSEFLDSFKDTAQPSPSPGTPGEGGGEGSEDRDEGGGMKDEREASLHPSAFISHPLTPGPHPNPLPEYRARGDLLALIEARLECNVLGAVDHHVLEARRVRQFCEFLEQSRALPLEDKNRFILMDKAGHLMYASHLSYVNDAELADDACDLLVQLVKSREKSGLYGARMIGLGCGGAVAVLGERTERVNETIGEIQQAFEQKTGLKSHLLCA